MVKLICYLWGGSRSLCRFSNRNNTKRAVLHDHIQDVPHLKPPRGNQIYCKGLCDPSRINLHGMCAKLTGRMDTSLPSLSASNISNISCQWHSGNWFGTASAAHNPAGMDAAVYKTNGVVSMAAYAFSPQAKLCSARGDARQLARARPRLTSEGVAACENVRLQIG